MTRPHGRDVFRAVRPRPFARDQAIRRLAYRPDARRRPGPPGLNDDQPVEAAARSHVHLAVLARVRRRPRFRISPAFKQEYDDGNCKVERKWEANGEYKEEVKCRGGRRAYPAYGYYR